MFKKLEWYLLSRVFFLAISVCASCLCMLKGWHLYSVLAAISAIYWLVVIYKHQIKVYRELGFFIESIKYKDFSRNFSTSNSSPALQALRSGFNEINTQLKTVAREKETHYQYLHKILELIDTGILSYETESGEVKWMNESLKKLLQLPYLKNIQALEKRNQSLYEQVISLNPGDSIIGTAQSQKILLAATAFQADGKKYHLVAFQNINEAIDETEAKAWQKLLSVLTHEIMNSIAPISSLADTIKNRIASIDKSTFPPDYLEDLEVGTSTIKRRSEGLIKFAETYRNLNKISNLNLEKFYVRDLFENLYNLMQPTFSKKNIELGINLRVPNLMLEADVNLLEQVLINLLLNAFEAVKEKDNPQISLLADTDKDKIRIQVIDNGNGIPANMLDKIFVPFFSTKKNGSGIGLTLCQQIMMLHKGHIQAQSKVAEGTVFSLQF